MLAEGLDIPEHFLTAPEETGTLYISIEQTAGK
jgi:hypothetical protein